MRAFAAAVEHLRLDLRFALRTFQRSPAFAASAVVTLALGIGASTALFSTLYGVALRPLPYGAADRLVVVRAEQDFDGAARPVPVMFPLEAATAWPLSASSAFERLAFHAASIGALAGGMTSEPIDVAAVLGPFFETVDGAMAAGRGLAAGDDGHPVAVVSARLSRRLFGGPSEALERSLIVNGQRLTVVGVAADTFQIPSAETDVWMTTGFVRQQNPRCCSLVPLGRLVPGVSVAAASAEVAAVTSRLGQEFPRALAGTRTTVLGLRDAVVGGARGVLMLLLAAALLLVVLAAANVASLLLARHAARSHEAAVQRAIGASTGRLVAQAMVESLLLGVGGGGLGVLLAAAWVRVLRAWPPTGLPRVDGVHVDGTVLTFALLLSVAVAAVIGLLPMRRSPALSPALALAPRTASGGRPVRSMLRVLTAGQLAVSAMLLVVAMLLGRGVVALLWSDLGVDTDRVVSASLNLMMDRTLTDDQQIDLVERVIARVGAAPDILAAGVATARPPDVSRMRVTLRGPDAPSGRATYQAAGVPVTPGAFRALGIRLLRGRLFDERDGPGAPPVVILSAGTAARLFGTGDPIGRTIDLPALRDGATSSADMTVVGVTADVKYAGLDQPADDIVYRPFAQQAWRSVFLLLRASRDPQAVTARLRGEIAAVDPAITVAEIATLDAVLADVTAVPRLRSLTVALFSLAATAIAAVGLYGVVAYSVSQRRTEFGVRLALGADGPRLRAMVLREAGFLAAAGLAVGGAGALAAGRGLGGMLFGVSSLDAPSFATALAALAVVALGASYIPARRAGHVDPAAALRGD